MPVCPNCGVAYVDGEFHECQGDQITRRGLWNAVKVVLLVCGLMFIALIVLVIGICGGFRS